MQGAGKGKEKVTLIERSDDSNQDERDSIYEKDLCRMKRETIRKFKVTSRNSASISF